MLGIRFGAALAVAMLLITALPVHAQEASTGTVALGSSNNSAAELASAGAPATFSSYWVGEWMAASGWGGLESMLKSAKAGGRTPVLYWYYWGDSISPSCVENGCNSRDRAEWDSLTTTLASKIQTIMQGSPTYVVLENEFNKGGITDASYAPTFDTYLEEKALELKSVSGVKIVLGYGSWGESAWGKFPKAIAASDMVGFQIMRASTDPSHQGDAMTYYRGAPDKIASVLAHIRTLSPGKDAFLYDVALSSYPDASWERAQNDTLSQIFARRAEYAENGLRGLVYREVRNVNMSPANYFGYAEREWGLKNQSGAPKLAWSTWLAAASGPIVPPPPPAANVPGSFEAEAMSATKGGAGSSTAASGGKYWNLWSNGELSQTLVADAPFDARIDVVASGQPAGGVAPRMEVRLGTTLLGTFDVAPGWAKHTVDATVPAGSSTLRILFTNDAVVNGEDRNLLVDLATVAPRPAPVNRAPEPSFEAAGSNLSWSFDATASYDPDGDAISYAWDLGDGNTASGATVSHQYASAGEKTVTLTVTDAKGASATDARTITAVQPNRAPTAVFELSGLNLSWSFDASGSSDLDGDALTYAWDLGDGSGATGPLVSHEYADAGDKTVTLTLTDARGLASTASRTLTAVQPNRAPLAGFQTTGSNLSWTFDARAASDPDGDALSFRWDLGDGSSVSCDPAGCRWSPSMASGDGTTAAGAQVTRTYASAGTKSIVLTVTDARGLVSTASATITAVQPNRAPVASATASGALDTWTFDAAGSTDADGDALTYAWSFSDGATATGARVTKTFAAAGSFTATVTVSDGRLSSGASVGVTATKPFVPFTATFADLKGNNYWVETDVAANKPVSAVCAMVNGGTCKALTLRDYGWAASFYVPTGAVVSFRATASSGESATSGGYIWPSATPVPTVTFTPYDGNTRWVQTKVDASAPVKSVCATVNGGSCQPLTYRSWGAWAAGISAKTGSKVVFYATFADNYVVKSPTYTWPVK